MNATHPISLNVIRIQSPCHADWESMRGNDRVRFCGDCKLNVFNLSELTRSQAEALINEHQGRLCVRYFQRTDGTILTQDCGRVLRAIRRTRRALSAVAALLLYGVATPLGMGSVNRDPKQIVTAHEEEHPANMMVGKLACKQVRPVAGPVMGDAAPLMGAIAPLPQPPTTQPATQPATQPTNRPASQPAEPSDRS
jgi:hypothetical protein